MSTIFEGNLTVRQGEKIFLPSSSGTGTTPWITYTTSLVPHRGDLIHGELRVRADNFEAPLKDGTVAHVRGEIAFAYPARDPFKLEAFSIVAYPGDPASLTYVLDIPVIEPILYIVGFVGEEAISVGQHWFRIGIDTCAEIRGNDIFFTIRCVFTPSEFSLGCYSQLYCIVASLRTICTVLSWELMS